MKLRELAVWRGVKFENDAIIGEHGNIIEFGQELWVTTYTHSPYGRSFYTIGRDEHEVKTALDRIAAKSEW